LDKKEGDKPTSTQANEDQLNVQLLHSNKFEKEKWSLFDKIKGKKLLETGVSIFEGDNSRLGIRGL
jgi:hypothetical protein